MVVEIDEPGSDSVREVRHTFHHVNARRFLTIEVNADVDFPTEEVLRRIEERAEDIRDSVVRLEINTLPEHIRDLRQDDIRQALNSYRPSYMAVVTNSAKSHRLRLGDKVVEQMSPRQALEIYLQTANNPPRPNGCKCC